MTKKNTVSADLGKWISYNVAANIVEVTGSIRKSVKPGEDEEIKGKQLRYGTEEAVLGAPDADPLFQDQLLGHEVGDILSFEYTYPDYEVDNLISLPVEFLLANGLHREQLHVGLSLNRDILKGKCNINGTAVQLEIIKTQSKGGKQFVILDSNDPLRGLKIRYDIEIFEIRDATAEETLAAGLKD